MIAGTAKLVGAEEVEIEVTLRMTVREARLLRADQSHTWPSNDLGLVLADVLRKTVDRVDSSHDVSR
jgi:hypothetical protein